ncbi:hypothetical protein HPB50_000173 [Hyalomma asiaticum]|uniref:Uncharacterized protein n=1 Tax=Hyalomma asiaticum TaxID=266040 RepID=A0ACB7TC77_HYAAI|nr:hypothetical protein HPB50_000173 [Hyalomma asiaticum]
MELTGVTMIEFFVLKQRQEDGVATGNKPASQDEFYYPGADEVEKAPEGHNFVTSGWVQEPWVKKVAAYTVIVVTQVNHSQSVNKPPVDVCTANALGANTCSAGQSCKAWHFLFKINR